VQPPVWLHGEMDNDAAAFLVNDAGTGDGTFLVRERQKGTYALTVVYNNKPTHHLFVRNQGTKFWTVNKKQQGTFTELINIVEFLGNVRPGWPVALKYPVAGDVTDLVCFVLGFF
jgi:hypothetical protein